ncbi:MAG: hypothetical protein ABL959_15700 [Pyrinomonadaceae bacterium]
MLNAATVQSHEIQMPFIFGPGECDRCFGIGLRISPMGRVEKCPTLQLGDSHLELSLEAKRIVRAVEILERQKMIADTIHCEVARTLAKYSIDKPCSARELGDRLFSYVLGDENRRRAVTLSIRFLRDTWLLPVGSRKHAPTGYWIITNETDFREYFERAKAEPITQLSTIFRLAKANWPEFAEQIEIDFWTDILEAQPPAA